MFKVEYLTRNKSSVHSQSPAVSPGQTYSIADVCRRQELGANYPGSDVKEEDPAEDLVGVNRRCTDIGGACFLCALSYLALLCPMAKLSYL